jgi:cytokinin riboside 5'-monophosphate phosphoribohydrolase
MNALCVYCSSSDHIDASFHGVAAEMGRAIAQRVGTLVYGGGAVGLMGIVARAVHAHGGKVVGVIPESMTGKEIAYRDANELIVTPDLRTRKRIMEERSDAFVALPGGFGTLEELFEILTHRYLGYHDKPIAILNAHGFFDPLVTLFEHMYEHRFARPRQREQYHVTDSVTGVFDYLTTA